MSNATGERLKEATRINLSLSNLGRVIRGIVSGDSIISYRDSKLTHLLQVRVGMQLLDHGAVVFTSVLPQYASPL